MPTSALPEGFGITVDPGVRHYRDGTVLVGGSPLRVMRLSPSGVRALRALENPASSVGRGTDDAGNSPAARVLGARLVAAGLAAPFPGAGVPVPSVTVVIPTRDRPETLDRCLAATLKHPQGCLAPSGVVPARNRPETSDRGLPATLDHPQGCLAPSVVVVVVDDGSSDPAAIADVCSRYATRLVRRPASGGPAAARNAALALVDTDLVAFLDDDCVPPPGWLESLGRHFADPAVGAVAPRVFGTGPGPVPVPVPNSPLDMGPCAARVAPGLPVSYVPTAALVVRRTAIDRFDEGLRYGEDVDLVWRLHDAGWTIRYDPRIVVGHAEPARVGDRLRRRLDYGTSAGPLSRRHPGRLAPLRLAPGPAVAALLLLTGRPRTAAAIAAAAPLPHHRMLRAAGLPAQAIPGLGLLAAAKTLGGLGRAACTVGALPITVALLAPVAVRPVRRALLAARTVGAPPITAALPARLAARPTTRALPARLGARPVTRALLAPVAARPMARAPIAARTVGAPPATRALPAVRRPARPVGTARNTRPRSARRRAVWLLVAAHLVTEWRTGRARSASTPGLPTRPPPARPFRWAAEQLAGDAAYGLGVWRGALAARTLEPLIPRRLDRTPASGSAP